MQSFSINQTMSHKSDLVNELRRKYGHQYQVISEAYLKCQNKKQHIQESNLRLGIFGLNRDGIIQQFSETKFDWKSDLKIYAIKQKITIENNSGEQKKTECQIKSSLNIPKFQFSIQYRSDSWTSNISSTQQQRSNQLKTENDIWSFSFHEYSDYNFWLEQLYPINFSDNIQDDYEIIKEIGKGNFAQVYLGKPLPHSPFKDNHEFVAIKRILKQNQEQSQIRQEIEAMQAMRRVPGLVQILQVYETKNSYHIVMELIKDGNLYTYIKSKKVLDRHQQEELIYQLLVGIKQMHLKGFVHRDIKPLNILMSQTTTGLQIKIADLGLCGKLTEEKKHFDSVCGTPGFMAPEIFRTLRYDQQSDIFSLGCIFYFILTQKLLISGSRFEDVLRYNRNFNIDKWNKEKLLCNKDEEFVSKFIQEDPMQRISIDEALIDEWFCDLKLRKLLRSTHNRSRSIIINNHDNKRQEKVGNLYNQNNFNFSSIKSKLRMGINKKNPQSILSKKVQLNFLESNEQLINLVQENCDLQAEIAPVKICKNELINPHLSNDVNEQILESTQDFDIINSINQQNQQNIPFNCYCHIKMSDLNGPVIKEKRIFI
ncbi:protein kinase domain containing protein [Stylonychia lemnae]|uniref:Protein kinase domain containing protein n=1 Tax=Stylonychia lemnae TaxID=5949 RepID=A0A078AHY4_STYLE|nr:protein kinase domain containing protein [Stylonychia lemnae]|eukprot:CDW80393.1 protein kinase domain containing protein [Stylonychia lemnae]